MCCCSKKIVYILSICYGNSIFVYNSAAVEHNIYNVIHLGLNTEENHFSSSLNIIG